MLSQGASVFIHFLSNTGMIKNIGYGLKNMRNSTFESYLDTHLILPFALPQH